MPLQRESSYPKQKKKKVSYLTLLLNNLFSNKESIEIDLRLDSVSHYPRIISNQKKKSLDKSKSIIKK